MRLSNGSLPKEAPESDYATHMAKWLEKGSTVLLRDRLCYPFQSHPLFLDINGKPVENDWFNAFADLDTGGMHARDEFKRAERAASIRAAANLLI